MDKPKNKNWTNEVLTDDKIIELAKLITQEELIIIKQANKSEGEIFYIKDSDDWYLVLKDCRNKFTICMDANDDPVWAYAINKFFSTNADKYLNNTKELKEYVEKLNQNL